MKILMTVDSAPSYVEEWLRWFGGDYMDMQQIIDKPQLLEGYDVLMTYYMDSRRIAFLRLWKHIYPKLKIVISTDADFWWAGTPWLVYGAVVSDNEFDTNILEGIKAADIIFQGNLGTYNLFKKLGVTSGVMCHPFLVDTYFSMNEQEQLSYEQRKEIGRSIILSHSMTNYDPKVNINFSRKIGLTPRLLGVFNNASYLQMMLEGGPGTYSERIVDQGLYKSEINRSLIGIEDHYAGGSRFTIECAIAGVPVVGSRYVMFLQTLNPRYTCKEHDCVDQLYEQTMKLISDPKEYNYVSKAMQIACRQYFGDESTRKRVTRHLSEHGIDLT